MDQLGEGVRKLILAGIGAAAVTKEKSEVILHELVKKGELTVEQGKVLNEELKYNIREAIRENMTATVMDMSDDWMDMVENMDDEQLEALNHKIHNTQQMRRAAEASSATAYGSNDTEEPVREDLD